MKNSFINSFKSKVKLNIKGRNIDRFINRLIKNRIDIISLEQIKYNEVNIIIFKYDLEKLEEIKTIYDIELIRYYGFNNIKNIININKYIIIFLSLSIIFLYILSNIIFNVEVIHSDKYIRNIIKKELKNHGIDKYKFKKSYEEKEKIKNYILNKYKNKIEWLEIERSGTKYIVRVEERLITKEKNNYKNRDLVAKKNGIITHVEASSGEIVKNTNDYVHKGDIIVSGNLMLNDEIINVIPAKGLVLAETWYTVKVKYPYKVNKIKKTNNKKTIYTIKFINKYFDLLNIKKYKNKLVDNKTIIKNNVIPISLVKQKQYEITVVNKKYNKTEVINMAIKKAKIKLLKNLKKDSKILKFQIISKKFYKKYIEIEVFFTVNEDITDYKTIDEFDKPLE